MRAAAALVALALMLGCARPVVRPSTAPQPVEPFADDPVSFIVPARGFPPGEVSIVRLCVAPDRSIASADVIESSGNARFDEMALEWARRIKLRSLPTDGAPVHPCEEVRVEIRTPSEPRVISGPDTSLG
jgi:Gram-negative bacterial TonB protein C-terminal